MPHCLTCFGPRAPWCRSPRHLGTDGVGRERRLRRHQVGITAFAEALRQEVTAQGVRVVVIEPGFVATELASHIADPAIKAAAKNLAENIRTLQPADIASAVLYALTQPEHFAVNEILIRPTDQTR
jgi:NADP-dependent 3-hydroxy acid dehydrogenase YdfG